MGALLRKADLVSSGSFIARRVGPWRTASMNDMMFSIPMTVVDRKDIEG